MSKKDWIAPKSGHTAVTGSKKVGEAIRDFSTEKMFFSIFC
jgi:hypothetical protein